MDDQEVFFVEVHADGRIRAVFVKKVRGRALTCAAGRFCVADGEVLDMADLI